MKLELAPRAVRDAERHARWWRENRPAARLLFDQERFAALEQIRANPEIGTIYSISTKREYRRVLLPKTRYHHPDPIGIDHPVVDRAALGGARRAGAGRERVDAHRRAAENTASGDRARECRPGRRPSRANA